MENSKIAIIITTVINNVSVSRSVRKNLGIKDKKDNVREYIITTKTLSSITVFH